jgi:hypothetical protein
MLKDIYFSLELRTRDAIFANPERLWRLREADLAKLRTQTTSQENSGNVPLKFPSRDGLPARWIGASLSSQWAYRGEEVFLELAAEVFLMCTGNPLPLALAPLAHSVPA